MNAAPEARGRLAGQFHLLGGLANVDEIEVRRFDQDVGRVIVDLGFQAAHDAAHTDRAEDIADHQVLGVQLPIVAVERRHAFARFRPAHNNRGTIIAMTERPLQQLIVIEGVNRLAEIEHHIVGHIDQIADRALPGQAQAALHPVG